MKRLFDHAFLNNAGRLVDVGGVVAWRGARDPMEVTAQAMGETFASIAAAVPAIESEAAEIPLDLVKVVVTVEMHSRQTDDSSASREENALVNATANDVINALTEAGVRLHYLSMSGYPRDKGTVTFEIEAQILPGTHLDDILTHLKSIRRYREIRVSGDPYSVLRTSSPA